MTDLELIEKLSNCRGVSGFEDEVLLVAREYLKGIATFEEDSMRNLYITPVYNKGNRPVVMLDAHADEVGFMVQAIKPDGTLRFLPVGSWSVQCMPSSRVQIYTKTGYITGVIASIPPHLMTAEQKNAAAKIGDLFIDIGATSAEEAAEFGVEVGAPVVPVAEFSRDEKHGLIFGKAFDDRLGVAALLKCIKEPAKTPLSVDIVGLISAQEEVGARGIVAATAHINADAAICFECGPADDTSAPAYLIQDGIKRGVMLRHMDATLICTPRFNALAQDVAKKNKIPVQMSVRSGGGTNGAHIISANGATPVIVAAIPVRYIHTFNCIAATDDFYAAVNLSKELLKSLDEKTIKGF